MKSESRLIPLLMCLLGSVLLVSCKAGPTTCDNSHLPRSPTSLRMGEGRVAFLGRYDHWLQSIAQEDRAWVIVDSVYQQMIVDRSKSEDTGIEWEPDAAVFEQHPELVEQLHGVLDRPVLGMPTDELGILTEGDDDADLMIGILLPHLSMIRAESELLRLDAASNVDPERVLMGLRSMARLQQYCSITDTLLEGLVTISIDSNMCKLVLSGDLDLSRWDSPSLERLADIFDAPPAWSPATRYLEGERALEENFMDWVYVDSVNDRLSPLGAMRLFSLTEVDDPGERAAQLMQEIVGPRVDQERMLDTVFDAGRKDLTHPLASERMLASIVTMNTGAFASDRLGPSYIPTGIIVPAIDRFVQQVIAIRAEHDAVRQMIDAHRYRARHGTLPSSSEDIDRE